MSDVLIAQQMEMEQESLTLGIKRYRESLAQGEAELPPGMRMIRHAVGGTAEQLSKFIEKLTSGKPGRNVSLGIFLSVWKDTPEIPAYVVCRIVVDGLTRVRKVQAVALEVASALEDMVNHDALRKHDPRAYKFLMRKITKSGSAGYRHVVLYRQMKYAGVKRIKWGQSERLRLGYELISMMENATGLFTIELKREGRHNTPRVLIPTNAAIEWFEQAHARCELLEPVFMPMVCQPKPWTNPFNGGYLTPKLRKPLVKGASRQTLEELKGIDMPMVYASINAMQDTAWSINGQVYDVLCEVWDGGGSLGGLPQREPLPLPAKNFTDKDAEDKTPAFTQWKDKARSTHEINVRLTSKRIQVQQKLWVAEKMKQFDRFYFAHALDFRGRAYAIASYLNPQGDDSGKAFLQFADSKPLGENGAFWLAVHGANCFGVDKVSFDERCGWVSDHTDEILEAAISPLDGSRWWTQADSPWQFLAFCFEWTKLHTHTMVMGQSDATFESALPVGMDGACNGLQNFSAMLRDPVGGASTNLVPSEKPADIYQQVANEGNKIIADRAALGDTTAQAWNGKLTRKLTKRNTMTVPYAVTEYGMRDQLKQEFRKLVEDGEDDPVIVNATMDDAMFLASVNHEAIGKVVIAARAAMDWLKEVARLVAEEGMPVHWTTPCGFPVVQNYRKMLGRRYCIVAQGRRVDLILDHVGTELDTRKQSSGISPNFVHALDAAHMQRTICKCVDAGLTSFAMVHDSYGTHAADVEVMSRLLRESFVEQYSADVLGQFRDEMLRQVKEPDAVPPCPPMGDLDLSLILKSDYFFA